MRGIRKLSELRLYEVIDELKYPPGEWYNARRHISKLLDTISEIGLPAEDYGLDRPILIDYEEGRCDP